MEGRRVTGRAQKSNPLFALFLCMIAAILVLLTVAAVLGVKLGRAERDLRTARQQIETLTETAERLEAERSAAQSRTADDAADRSEGDETRESQTAAAWLDLSGHSEVEVQPTALLDGYKTYYATAGVNLRSGPATTYKRLDTVAYGAAVQVAARESGWSFAKVGSKFGWLSSDYLSEKQPPARTVKRAEATSGSLRTN